MRNQISEYKQVNNYTGVTDATPHQLVKMLLEGATGKLAAVKGMLERGEKHNKGELVGQVISIVTGLQSSLDREAGGEIADNLDSLYDYMVRRLVVANMNNDIEIINEVLSLLREIESAWNGIPLNLREAGSEQAVAIGE